MSGTIKNRHRPEKMARMVERAGIGHEAFQGLVDRTWARRDEVPGSISRLAAAAMAVGVPVLSHDDATPADRSWYRNRGARISEFPTTVAATEAAIAGNDATVFGAPNVVRGGSHTGCPSAAEMVQRGLCTILASDYYYPALLLAPFRLESLGAASLETAWSLVSSRPAEALGLTDRGVIAEGRRADLVLVDAAASAMPRVVATICGGRIVFLSEAHRLDGGPTRTRFATVQTR
jgi:alpha-D-ribose 1-methylphosphonate 5-triphosphate diphosphatase